MTYTLGVDPSSIPAKTAYAAVDADGKLQRVHTSEQLDALGIVTFSPAAVIIEWAEATAGAYTPCRSRVADLMRLAVEQQRILDLYRDVCPVYCVPRRVILAQAGYIPFRGGKADPWVSAYLMQLGYGKLSRSSKPGWRASPLNTTDKRDALMAALFRYNDPRNKEYQVNE